MRTVRFSMDEADARDVAAIVAVEVGRKANLARMFATFTSEGDFVGTAASYAQEAVHLAGVAENLFRIGDFRGPDRDTAEDIRRRRQLVEDYAKIGARTR